jgi:hypothetical protein
MPASARSPEQPIGGTAAPPTDISAGMPRTMRDDLTGDFLGRGYDQRMRAEVSNLNIYDSPSRGGALLRSTPMDLAPAPDSGVYNPLQGSLTDPTVYDYTWAYYGHESSQTCATCFQALFLAYHLNTIYLARNNDTLFIAGTKGNVFAEGTLYQNLLYALPPDGSCASANCAWHQVTLPNQYPSDADISEIARAVGVTSLAAGYVGGVPYLAVGLSDFGVQIYNVEGTPQLTSTFIGMAPGDGSQTPPTALAWDPSGSGLLAVGVISWADEGFFVQVDGNGIVQPNWLAWAHHGTDALIPSPLSAAFGWREDGSPVVAFGMSDGSLQLVDPKATGTGGAYPETNALAVSSAPGGAIVAVNPIPRFDGTVGGSDYAVSYQTGLYGDAVLKGTGGLLRWDGTSSGLTAQPVNAVSPNTVSPDWDSFREWYPGIKEGRLQISNTSGEPITVALHASPNPGYGCWYAPSWADAPAFPPGGITVAAGKSSKICTMGAYTAGAQGGCAATDATGLWLGYLAITPVSHPADTRLVGLRLNRDMTVDVTDQAGGSTTVSITNAQNQLAAFGLWTVTVGTLPAPTPQPSPKVTGSRVTPADWPGPAVYRFKVTGAMYQLPTPYGNQVMVPPLLVQGSVDGNSWTSLGSLVPPTQPAVTAGSPAQLTLGKATFWWENPAGQPAYQYIRVGLGPAGVPSQVALADLSPPADETNLSGPQIAPTSSDGTPATPVASGVDQAPLAVQVLDASSNPLPGNDPSYGRIFYRDASGNLITNLFLTGADPAYFIGVSPYPGAYPNDGSVTTRRSAVAGTYHYVSTTNTHYQDIYGYVGGALNSGVPAPSQKIPVQALGIGLLGSSSSQGISLTGCADFTGTSVCRLFPISAGPPAGPPALFLDTKNGVQIGILTTAQATTSVASLPLQQSAGMPEHLLASAPLTVSETAATLTDTSAFLPGDLVDTWLVAHGVLVPVVNIPASG